MMYAADVRANDDEDKCMGSLAEKLSRWWCMARWIVVVQRIDGQIRWQIVGRLSSSSGGLILYSTCKLGLAIPEDWIPQTPFGWIQEIQAGSCT